MGVLFLHGYTGGRHELDPLFVYLKSRYDFEYEFPVYPGHGTVLDLKKVTGNEWYAEAMDAYTELRKRVDKIYIIGFSMGGVFAAHIAQQAEVERLFLIAPAFDYTKITKIGELGLTPTHFSEHMKLNMYGKIKNRVKDIPFRAFQEFKNIIKLKREGLENVTADTLIVHGTLDLLVPYKSSVETAGKIQGAELELLEGAPHLFAYTEESQLELNILAERFLFKHN
ncbi:alpha/beta hydrolase [Salinicoccus halodurans]|uniref:alpha/beta hydrolase n=1 Tax=Salinicoccus halodurans TaxID=407035 RepID=UPI0009429093|nr:alpha/beta fold hydrolase [Salinicoccus halodurans]